MWKQTEIGEKKSRRRRGDAAVCKVGRRRSERQNIMLFWSILYIWEI